MESSKKPSKGVMYGALTLMAFCTVILLIIAFGAYKAMTQSAQPQTWCEYGVGQCQDICQKKELTILYFHAGWCPACKKMNTTTFSDPRVIEKLSSYGRIKADVDRLPELTQSANVRSIPTVVGMKGCREVLRVSGAVDPDTFLGFLDGLEKISKER